MIFDISPAKTGTTSLCEAMRILGYRVTHGVPSANVKETLHAIQRGDVCMPWFKDYDFIGNVFGYAFKELDYNFPNARFIYLERDISEWIKSTKLQLTKYKPGIDARSQLDVFLRVCNIKSIFDVSELRLYDLIVSNRSDVHEYFANADNLLIMQITQGWEPLCRFLGKEIPDQPFPFLNKTENDR